MSRRVRNARAVVVLLSGIFLSSMISATNGRSANPTPQFPIGSGSWNPSVSCSSPWIVRIADITDNTTGSASLSSSIFNPGITSPVGAAKRWLTPGPTPPGWVSPGPACTIVNSHGAVALFVELDGVKRVGISNEDCTGNYDAVNGGTSNGGSFCDSTFNIYDPAVVSNYGTSCTSATDPTCYGRIHVEIDHDWKAANYCGPSTTCDDAALGSQTTTSSLIDFQGFISWDPNNLNQQSHSFNGWEIHPLTAWRQHQTNPALSASFTFSPSSPNTGTQVSFSAIASGGTQPYSFTWNFGDGSTGAGSSAGHTYTVTGSYSVILTVQDSSSPQETVTKQQMVNVANPPPLNASYTFSPSSPGVGQSVTFAGLASGGTSPYTFNWSFGDGATATGGTATHSYNTVGIYNTQLTVTDKTGAVKNVTQSITIGPNFSISTSPASLTLRTGSSNTSRITVSSINGFSGTVSLATSASPPGLTVSLNVTSLNLIPGMNASSTLTVSSTNPATYTVNITSTGGTITHTTSIQVRVATGDFSISAAPVMVTIQPSINGTSSIQLSNLSQFSESISLSALVSQPGLVTSFSPSTVSISPGASALSTLAFSSVNYANYTITVTAVSGTVSHSSTVAVRVFPSSVVIASDSASGTTSLYTTGGQKLIQDSAGKMIAVYVDSSGRISISYDNADPSKGGWSTPVKSPTPAFPYSWPAAVLVSLNSLRIIAVGGSVSGGIVDIPVTISRGSGNNVTGFGFGTPTSLDSSGLGKYTAAILLHNNDILATWGWENTTTSIAKSLRWDPTTGWTNLSGSSTIPDNVFIDNSVIQYFVPNMFERPDNHNIYLFALRFVSSGRMALVKATWSGSAWLWGSQNLTYETNASDADDDAISLSWDPSRSVIVAAYGISGTHTYGVFTLTSSDVKTHIDTPTLAVAGDRGWGAVGVQTNTGDYYLFLISVNTDVGGGTLGYIRMPSGGLWNATITWLNTATDNQVTSLRLTGPGPSLDFLYVEGTSSPANIKFVRLGAPNFTISSNPATLTIQTGSQGTTTIALSSVYNFAATLNLSATVSPTGPTPTLTPATLILFSGSVTTSTLNFNPTASGVYTITIVATVGLLSQSTTITVTVTDFTVSSTQGPVTVTAGTQGSYTITITALNGLTGIVTLSVTASIPAGLSCTIPASVTFGISPQLATLNCSATSAGNYTVAVNGTNGPLTHTTSSILFHVVDFSLSTTTVSPSQIFAGGSGNSSITITALNGLTGVVNLAVSASTPAGLTCTSPASVNLASSSQTVTLSCTASVPNTYAITVTGNAGILGHTTAPLTFTVVDFTITASTVSPTQILAGGTGSSTITIMGVNGPTGTANTSVSLSTPLGLTCTLPSSIVLGASPKTEILSCTSNIANSYTVTVTGIDGPLSHTTATITFTIVDFSITAGNTSPAQVLAGSSGTSTINVNAVNGLTGTVGLMVSASTPPGMTCSFNSTSLTISTSPQTSSLSCISGVPNTYTVIVTGTDGTLSHTTATITFTVVDFTITAGAIPAQQFAGTPGTSTIAVNAVNGLTGTISLTLSASAPTGLACTLTPVNITLVTSPQTSTLSCASGTPATYIVTVTGSDGALSHTTAIITFAVVDFTIIGGVGSPAQILAGSAGTATITVNAVNGLTGNVSLTVSPSTPTGLSCTLPVASVTVGASPQIAGLSCSTQLVGTYTEVVTGTDGVQSHSTLAITFTVVDFNISTSTVSPGQVLAGSTGNSTILATPLNGLTGTITLSVSASTPVGLSCTVPASIVIGGSAQTATLSCSSSTANTYIVSVIGREGTLSHTTQPIIFVFVDFSIAASPVGTEQILAGSLSNSTVSLTGLNGFSGLVSLATNSTSCFPNPTVITGSGSSALSCSFTGSGAISVTVTGTTGSLSHQTSLTFTVQDFTITPSQPIISVLAGSTGTSTIVVNSLNGFSGLVNLGTNIASCTLTTISVPSMGNSTLSCSFPLSATIHIEVIGTSGADSHISDVTFIVQDFAMSVNPTTEVLNGGAASTPIISIDALNGFSGPVRLTANSTACTISATIIVGSGSANLSCSVSVLATHIVITGQSGPLSHSTLVTYLVQDFTIVASPSVDSSYAGGNATFTINVTSLNGYSGSVQATPSVQSAVPSGRGGAGSGRIVFLAALPPALSLTVSPSSQFITSSATGLYTLTIMIPSGMSPGNYIIVVTASDGHLSHAAQVTLTVTDFSFSSSNTIVSMSPGNNATVTLSLQSLNGFQGNLTLFSSTSPAGLVGSLNASSIFLVTRAGLTLLINVPSNTQQGNYTIAIVATAGTLSHTVYITVKIQAGGAGSSAGPSSSGIVTTGFAGVLTLVFTLPYPTQGHRLTQKGKRRHSGSSVPGRRPEFSSSSSMVILTNSWFSIPTGFRQASPS